MVNTSFNYSPTPEILQQLVKPALLTDIESLSKAVRIYVILKDLYQNNPRFSEEEFTYNQWRDSYFIDAKSCHPRDKKPTHDDLHCNCGKTIKQLLFPEPIAQEEKWKKWQQAFIDFYQNFQYLDKLNNFLDKLEKEKPFQVTGKAIMGNFDSLKNETTGLTWLKKDKNTYQKIEQLPTLNVTSIKTPTSNIDTETEDKFPFFETDNIDFFSLAYTFSHPINNIQRFFIHADYRYPVGMTAKITSLQRQLRKIWEQKPVPPASIIYHSASQGNQDFTCIIYPVCIYYYQRSFYLCAYGTTPKNPPEINWYNYRIDHIQSLKTLSWNSEKIPDDLRTLFEGKIETIYNEEFHLNIYPTLEEIQTQIEEAYGIDFFQPKREMLLAFPHDFHQRYIKNTIRHNTFKPIEYRQALPKIAQSPLTQVQKTHLTNKIQSHPEYAYYTMNYRQDDNSVIMRLRAWCPNVEVLLPEDLRSRMREDMKKTWQLYQKDS